jgi:hypothetical protein
VQLRVESDGTPERFACGATALESQADAGSIRPRRSLLGAPEEPSFRLGDSGLNIRVAEDRFDRRECGGARRTMACSQALPVEPSGEYRRVRYVDEATQAGQSAPELPVLSAQQPGTKPAARGERASADQDRARARNEGSTHQEPEHVTLWSRRKPGSTSANDRTPRSIDELNLSIGRHGAGIRQKRMSQACHSPGEQSIVSVEEEHELAARLIEATIARLRCAHVPLTEHSNTERPESLCDLEGPVLGAVVDDDDFAYGTLLSKGALYCLA